MEAHEARVGRCGGASCCDCCYFPDCVVYNEVVLSASVWERLLPITIEAIGYHASSARQHTDSKKQAEQVYADYRRAFPSSLAPLVRLNLKITDQPFSLHGH